MSALLVDLGGTHLRCGLAENASGVRVVCRTVIRDFALGCDSSEIWEDIVCRIAGFAASARDRVPPGAPLIVSFPGPVLDGGRILDAPTVAGRSDMLPDLRAMIAERTGRAVYLLNDISAAAWHFSQTVAARRFMVVTVSSGIGSKIFDRCHPNGVLDDVVYAGEIGHLTVDHTPGAPQCDCGGSGHLGAVASGRGIEREARRLAKSDPSFLQSACAVRFGSTPENLNNEEHLVPAARLRDAWALDVVRRCTEPLAQVLLTAVLAAGLERVVMIGGFAVTLGEVYLEVLRDAVSSRCDYRVMSGRLEDLIVMGDEDACLLGAAVYARHRVRQ